MKWLVLFALFSANALSAAFNAAQFAGGGSSVNLGVAVFSGLLAIALAIQMVVNDG